MGYDLHITRADWHFASEEYPISREEWRAVADGWPGMAIEGRVDYTDTGPVPVYELRGSAEHPASFHWRNGEIMVRAFDHAREIARLAERLGARLIGDDDEQYFTNGTVAASEASPPPPLLARPLYVNEVAAAWRSRLRREESQDEGSVAAQLLRSFAAIAVRDVAICDVPDADLLLYDYGTQWFDGEQIVALTVARQFTQDDRAGGDIVRIECTARYRPTPALVDARRFREWMPADDIAKRRAWLATISERPEWSLLEQAVPERLSLCGEPVYNSRIFAARGGS